MPTTSTFMGLQIPTVGGDSFAWGGYLNSDLVAIDALAVYNLLNVSTTSALPVGNGPTLVKATGNGVGITLTLPDATVAANKGRVYVIVKVDGLAGSPAGVGAILVQGFGSQTISGQTSFSISSQWSSLSVQADGANWIILADGTTSAILATGGVNSVLTGGTSGGLVATELLTSATYALLASAGVTSSVVTNVSGGNVGSYPTNTISGSFVYTPPAAQVVATSQNQTDLTAAYVFFSGLTSTPIAASFATTTFTATPTGYNGGAGFVGHASSTLLFSGGTVTLDGANLTNPVFVFQVGSALNVTTAATTINLINGATAANVVWVVGSAATFDAHNHAWAGTIIAQTGVTLNSISLMTLNGRALVTTGPVIVSNTTTITVPRGGASAPVFSSTPTVTSLTATGAIVAGTTLQTGSFTVASLPAGIEGQIAYATNGRKVGEGPGNGTGVPVYYSADLDGSPPFSGWHVFSTDALVQA
jgi:Ice-binding-like